MRLGCIFAILLIMKELIIDNLTFSYDKTPVLEHLFLEYSSKDFLAIIGPNGGGKSTLLKLMLGLLEPKEGSITIFGKMPKEASERIAYVPQNTNVNHSFPVTVMDVVLMGCLGHKWFGFYSKEDRHKAIAALKRVGMYEHKNERIGELSGGQRQRVFIARALCGQAELLMMDEPTASIDTEGQVQIFDLLKSLNKDKGVIVISHDINVVLGYATKIAHVNKHLYMHDAPELATQKAILKTINETQGHICPVELITPTTCTHPDHHHKAQS